MSLPNYKIILKKPINVIQTEYNTINIIIVQHFKSIKKQATLIKCNSTSLVHGHVTLQWLGCQII